MPDFLDFATCTCQEPVRASRTASNCVKNDLGPLAPEVFSGLNGWMYDTITRVAMLECVLTGILIVS